MLHLQHEIKQLHSIAMSLQVLRDVEIQNAQWLHLYVHALQVLEKERHQAYLYI